MLGPFESWPKEFYTIISFSCQSCFRCSFESVSALKHTAINPISSFLSSLDILSTDKRSYSSETENLIVFVAQKCDVSTWWTKVVQLHYYEYNCNDYKVCKSSIKCKRQYIG